MSSVPSGPSAEDERQKLLTRIDALLAWPAVRGTAEAFAFAASGLLVEVRDMLAALASRAPAGEPTDEERLKVVMHEALDTFGTWTPKQRHERAGYDGYYNRPPDWLVRYLAESVAKSLASGAAPDGRVPSEQARKAALDAMLAGAGLDEALEVAYAVDFGATP